MKIKTSLSIVMLFCFLVSSLFTTAQDGGPNQHDLERVFELEAPYALQQNQLDSLITWQERLLVHVDKPVIDEGSPLFFKAYTLTGPNRVRATLSEVLKLELVNGTKDVLATQYHKIEDGMAKGAFNIPKKLENGSYTLRAYTRWMQNYGESFYYTKELFLGSDTVTKSTEEIDNEEIDVSFYPEGGNLISNFTNRLLIKAITKEGKPININGDIIDGSGHKVFSTVSFNNGIMSTIFQPNSTEEYSFITDDGSKFKLPKVIDNGYVLNVNNLNATMLSIRVQASQNVKNNRVWMKGAMSGVAYFNQELDLDNSVVELEIPKNGIPFGVMTISLEDENGRQWSQRPVFIDADNTLNLSIVPLNESSKGGELAFKVKVTDGNSNPIATQISLSATNRIGQNWPGKAKVGSGFTWEREELNTTSQNSARTNRFSKDLQLLTSVLPGERAFQDLPTKIKYPFQKGLDLFGYAYDLNNKLLKNTKVQMLSASDSNVIIKELETDVSGRLRVENLQLQGANDLVFRTEGDNTKSRLVKLVPIQESYDKDHNPKSILAFEKVKNRETVQASPWEPINSDDLIELDEVAVTENKIERPRAMSPTYGIKANKTRTVVQNIERPKFLFQLLAELPGVMAMGNAEAPMVSFLSANMSGGSAPNSFGSALDATGPLWIIDGFIVGNSPGVDPTWGLNFWDIDRIEVPDRSDWSIYGSRAAFGVIMIYTRNGSGADYINRKEGRLNFQGFDESPSFDQYSERIAKRPKRYKGKAATLFWNPSITTDANGEAIVRFTPPMEYQNLEIKVSAVTEKGQIASARKMF